MARTIKTWITKVKPGRIEDAMALFKEAKDASGDAQFSLLYAESAGEFSGTFTLVASYDTAEAAGRANDSAMESAAGQALWRKFNDAGSPVEAVATATYTGVAL